MYDRNKELKKFVLHDFVTKIKNCKVAIVVFVLLLYFYFTF